MAGRRLRNGRPLARRAVGWPSSLPSPAGKSHQNERAPPGGCPSDLTERCEQTQQVVRPGRFELPPPEARCSIPDYHGRSGVTDGSTQRSSITRSRSRLWWLRAGIGHSRSKGSTKPPPPETADIPINQVAAQNPPGGAAGTIRTAGFLVSAVAGTGGPIGPRASRYGAERSNPARRTGAGAETSPAADPLSGRAPCVLEPDPFGPTRRRKEKSGRTLRPSPYRSGENIPSCLVLDEPKPLIDA